MTGLLRALCMVTILTSTTGLVSNRAAHDVGFDTDSRKVLIDNCATASITNDINDCCTKPVKIKRRVKGVAGTFHPDIYETTIRWDIEDDDGKIHTITLPRSFYIPSTPTRLLSPQHWAQTAKDNKPVPRGTRCTTYGNSIELVWGQGHFKRTVPLNKKGSNVGEFTTAPGYTRYETFCKKAGTTIEQEDNKPLLAHNANLIEDDDESIIERSPATVGEDESTDDESIFQNDNLDDEENEKYFPSRDVPMTTEFLIGPNETVHVIPNEEERLPESPTLELLRTHHRMGHLSMAKIQSMARQSILPKRLANCKIPVCTACMYGKATRRPWRIKGHRGTLDVMTSPGQCVSVDQMISKTPGYIAHLRGTPTRDRYKVATIFVDHYSGIGYVHLQRTTSAKDTIEAKDRFEAWADTHGVAIRHYHADNGIFADNKFREAVQAKGQRLTFSGVNAHFQSGMAERRIRDLQESARTMLVHAQRRWPSTITTNLWPYAIRYANDMFNEAPMKKQKDKTPMELFTGSTVRFNTRLAHTFGCPAYVLDNNLQSGTPIPKWSERARVGIFLGYSPQHSRTIGLILSLSSGLTSPQFHVQYDDAFETLRASFGEAPPVSQWQYKAGFTKRAPRMRETASVPQLGSTATSPRRTRIANDVPHDNDVSHNEEPSSDTMHPTLDEGETLPQHEGARRSQRTTRRTQRYQDYLTSLQDENDAIAELAITAKPAITVKTAQANSNPDVMYWHEAMKQKDREEFIKAAQKEVQDHSDNGLWEVVKRKDIPKGALISRGVWSCVRKRRLKTREVYKWKSRLAYDGSMQEKGVNYWETYAPVIQWPVVRFVLTMALTQGWHIKQVDYVLAYTQAVAETDMYMEAPRSFTFDTKGNQRAEDYVLKIKQNYYGQKQGARVWNQHLVKRLKDVGFQQSAYDECLFYHGKCVYILYTDDSLLMGPDQDELNRLIVTMEESGLKMTYEDGVNDFLGVNVEKKDDGTIHLTQPHLIDSILHDLHLVDETTKTKDTPAPTTVRLRQDQDGKPFDGHFHYRAAIGKLNFLEKSTRPDISFAVHQCARFCENPRAIHGKAVKHIARYLAATKKKGIILNPDETQSFQVFADADFAGNFNKLDHPNRDMARSRTGFAVIYAGCPILWQSKLQSEIALSTTEAEIISLSHALRTVIPLMSITREMKELGFPVLSTTPQVHCKAFEDNSGAVELATVHKYRPRTRYLCTKLFHFKSFVERKEIEILPCATDDQTADIFTKSLSTTPFEKHRKKLQGW